jgi:hypothetical protein
MGSDIALFLASGEVNFIAGQHIVFSGGLAV